MPTEEYEALKETLKKAATPEAMKEAAEAMRRYLERRGVKGSRPMLVSLGFKKPYPSAIRLEDIPKELERSSEFYELMRKVITKEK